MKASTSDYVEIKYLVRFCVFVCVLLFAADSVGLGGSNLSFEPVQIEDNAENWWARALGDINNDGVLDLVVQNNNAHGGWLGWYEAKKNGKLWTRHIIANKAPKRGTFACGDMAVGDIDNDGDIDVLGFEHPGEWDESGAPTQIYWYEYPGWEHHYIGQGPDFLKDVDLADFNRDNKLDLVAITYEENKLVVFRQNSSNSWTKVQDFKITNLHEGMDVGDIDGDSDPDVAANGYWVENPGGDLTGKWTVRSIDSKWHNQSGEWSKNATKVFCRDITGDGRVEVFISHSERKGYPVSWYESPNPKNGSWTEHIIASELAAAHSLKVFDMDKDGDYDVVTGVNKDRAKDLKVNYWPLVPFRRDSCISFFEGRYSPRRVSYEGALCCCGQGQMGTLKQARLEITELSAHQRPVLTVAFSKGVKEIFNEANFDIYHTCDSEFFSLGRTRIWGCFS